MKKYLKITLLACLLACVAVCSVMFAACGAKRLSDTFTVTFVLEDQPDALIMSVTSKFKVNFMEEDGTAIGSATSGSGVNLNEGTNSATIDVSGMTGTVIVVGLKSIPSGYAYVDENGNAYVFDNNEGASFDLTKVSEGTITLKKVAE